MTPRVPKWKCSRCNRWRNGRCPLEDLEPCSFVYHPDEKAKDKFLALATIVAGAIIAASLLFLSCTPKKPEPQFIPKWSAVQLLRQQHRNELSEWEMLQMAIILTESRFNPDATGAAKDAGLYQMTPVYVAEVNRVAGTDYVHADAYDPDKAVAMFAALQGHYNPSRNTDTAIYFHNKSAAYRQRVLKNLELIRRYEAARKAVTK